MLVTVPEETPVNELIETAYSLEDEVGVALGPVVVNGVVPDAGRAVDTDPERGGAGTPGSGCCPARPTCCDAAAEFRRARMDLQRTQLDRMADELPLPQLHLPYLFTSQLDRDHLDLLADALLDRIGELPPVGGA